MSEEMLRLLAQADGQPVESDAPDPAGEIVYDAGLQADLEEHGPEALREYGRITVRDVDVPARWNAVLWFCAKWGLEHEPAGTSACVITDPKQSA